MGRVMRMAMMAGPAFRKVGGTWDASKKGAGISLSSGNLQAAGSGSVLSTNEIMARGRFRLTIAVSLGSVWIGLGRADMNKATFIGGGDGRSIGIINTGDIYYGGVVVGSTGQTAATGDIMTAVVNKLQSTIKIAINGGPYCTPIDYGALGLTGTLYAAAAMTDNDSVLANFT